MTGNRFVNVYETMKQKRKRRKQRKQRKEGGKYREVPLKNELIELIQDYLSTERKESRYSDSPFLFVSQRSPHMIADATGTFFTENNIHLHAHKQTGIG